jgi:hypothetical protein
MHCDAADLVADQLALAGVKSSADVDAEVANVVAHRESATDRARGPIESSQEAVSGGVHLAAAKALELPPHQLVVSSDEVVPVVIAEPRGSLGRSDDVGEENRRQDSIGLVLVMGAGQEELDRRARGTGRQAIRDLSKIRRKSI